MIQALQQAWKEWRLRREIHRAMKGVISMGMDRHDIREGEVYHIVFEPGERVPIVFQGDYGEDVVLDEGEDETDEWHLLGD